MWSSATLGRQAVADVRHWVTTAQKKYASHRTVWWPDNAAGEEPNDVMSMGVADPPPERLGYAGEAEEEEAMHDTLDQLGAYIEERTKIKCAPPKR